MTTSSSVATAAYVHAMMRAFAPDTEPGRRLVQWLSSNQDTVGIDFRAAIAPRTNPGQKRKPQSLEQPLPRACWDRLRAALKEASKDAAEGIDVITANIDAFAGAVGLNELESLILRFVLHCNRNQSFDWLCDTIISTKAIDSLGLLALCLDRDSTEIWGRLSRGPLRSLKLIQADGDGSNHFSYSVTYRVFNALMPPNDGIVDVERRLIGAPLSPRLAIDDYGHIERERDFVLRLLRGALETGKRGVNILLYGPPGTGKTEFCRMAAQAIGCDLFAVGESDDDGDEPARNDRIEALRLADKLGARRGRTLLLFDEMEDILQDDGGSTPMGQQRRAGSKVFFNRMLERNRVPVLWTTNAIYEFDPAFLRRMTFALEMKPLPAKNRAGLWLATARKNGIELADAQADSLARRHKVPPSLMTGAIEAVALARGQSSEIEMVANALAGPCFGRARPQMARQGNFQSELANADLDLERLTIALSAANAARDASFCFYGPPGTGKSAFARVLAEATGLEPMHRRGSDILSKWIGGTEKNLAAAFQEARQDQCFLIIDEVESFLWNRAGASQSWEVSMVNELLVQMESHPLPFACTTNHLNTIDSAALRRFSFKVKFDYMRRDQVELAYRQFFDREAPLPVRRLEHLTPGDFAVVARKVRVLGPQSDVELLRMLEQEVVAKDLKPCKIGF